MDITYVKRIVSDKMRNAETYWIAAVVGTLINAYGHLLVPWIRGSEDPWAVLAQEFQAHPTVTIFSILLAYAFPLMVGVISSVLTRYRNRRIESVADFPESKPDPVFRADRSGDFVEVGAATQAFFRKYDVDTAQKILGAAIWSEIAAAKEPGGGQIISFEPESTKYVVSYTPTANDRVNVYMTRLLTN